MTVIFDICLVGVLAVIALYLRGLIRAITGLRSEIKKLEYQSKILDKTFSGDTLQTVFNYIKGSLPGYTMVAGEPIKEEEIDHDF
jgi:hypothetical protein